MLSSVVNFATQSSVPTPLAPPALPISRPNPLIPAFSSAPAPKFAGRFPLTPIFSIGLFPISCTFFTLAKISPLFAHSSEKHPGVGPPPLRFSPHLVAPLRSHHHSQESQNGTHHQCAELIATSASVPEVLSLPHLHSH